MATPAHTTHSWRFGVYEVDAQREELRRAGTPIKLREQPFRILVFLLEHAGELVTREDLRKVLWPADTYVDFDHSLNTAVMKLREALSDTADKPLYIETIPKKGYRFVAPVVANGVAGSYGGSPSTPAREQIDSTQYPTSAKPTSQRWIKYTVVAGAGFAVLAALGFLMFLRERHAPSGSRTETRQSLSSLRSVPVTNGPGNALAPAISPDGKWIAYLWNGPERTALNIYVQLLGSTTPLRLTSSKGANGPSVPSWSPDGTEIAYSQCDGNTGGIFAVPAMGGAVRKLTTRDCWQGPKDAVWLPDGKEILTIDRCAKSGLMSLTVFSVVNGERRCVTDPTSAGFTNGVAYFTLSPDGKTIVFGAPTNGKCCDLYMVPSAGGTPRQLTFDQLPGCGDRFIAHCLDLMWTQDSQSIIVSKPPGLTHRVPVNGGAIEEETQYQVLGSLSKDGRRLFYTDYTNVESPSIWRADLAGPGGPVVQNQRLSYTQEDLDAQPSPDGSELAWMSFRSGDYEIWTGGSHGGTPVQLTHLEQRTGSPRWSPDGKWIAFDMWDPGDAASQIYIVDPDGKNLRAITGGPYTNAVPSWSHDGKWIYFVSYRSAGREVWKHSLEDGTEVQLTHHGGFDPFESSDGRTVYFTKFRDPGLWSVPSNGGQESVVFTDQPRFGLWGLWALTKDGIYYLDMEQEPRPTIMFYRFATRSITPVLMLDKQAPIWFPDLSATPDGKTLFYTQYEFQSVIKMIELPQ